MFISSLLQIEWVYQIEDEKLSETSDVISICYKYCTFETKGNHC